MGITSFSIELIEKYKRDSKSVLELGAQNLYDKMYSTKQVPYADQYYLNNGFDSYECVDLNGENNAMKIDLSQPVAHHKEYDLVTDFGTSEHVGKDGKHDIEAIYNCWRHKHNWLKQGGIMINENPKTGNWPGHGFNYYCRDFYRHLCALMHYEILDFGEHPAMGNTTDGLNVYCVFKKVRDYPFLALEIFEKLQLYER